MEIREVQLQAAYDALYDLRASSDRQIAALRAEIDALRRVTAADSSYIRFASKADVNSRHG
jgi:ribosomal protein L20A (L18A)